MTTELFISLAILIGLAIATLVAEDTMPKTNPYRRQVLKSGLLLLGGISNIVAILICVLSPESFVAVFVAAVIAYSGLKMITSALSGQS